MLFAFYSPPPGVGDAVGIAPVVDRKSARTAKGRMILAAMAGPVGYLTSFDSGLRWPDFYTKDRTGT